jgi:Transposase DDE domain group 1
MSDVERLWLQQAVVSGDPPSGSTIGRTLGVMDDGLLARIAKARARVRRHVWNLLRLRPGGFPWLVVAGKWLTGWIVIDIDATVIIAHSVKDGAAVTFKKIFSFHPLAAWCANTTESPAMLLRSGNAGSNTVVVCV